ncbi:MAG: diacylglycerol kinase family protein [Clostridia bacterium]|nr:diacylglycerol kinase family protein [Clostridia bacterium]
MDKHKLHNDNFIDALKNAIKGLAYTVKTQLNIKRQLGIAFFVIALGLILKIPKIEFMFLIFSISLVIFAETVNTSIETIVDMYTEKYNEKARIAKDVGAGAVLVCTINSIVIAIIVFAERILNFL